MEENGNFRNRPINIHSIDFRMSKQCNEEKETFKNSSGTTAQIEGKERETERTQPLT